MFTKKVFRIFIIREKTYQSFTALRSDDLSRLIEDHTFINDTIIIHNMIVYYTNNKN